VPRRYPQLAKLSRPRLHAPVPRVRLFQLIDGLRMRPLIWIQGPPGAGKTTLAATYLEAAHLPGLWYQLDGEDSDPASFFYYLRQAAQSFSRKHAPLPLLTPEYLENLHGFTRRFFRRLFAQLPHGAVVVFDNYQEVPADAQLHELLATAIDEIPEHANLLVISRARPPSAFARADVSGRIGHVDWNDLRLTAEETDSLAHAQGKLDAETVRMLNEQSQGWAAGVALLLERIRRDGSTHLGDSERSSESTFDYFASQIFDPEPAETRELLMATALLPYVTVVFAEAISGNPLAGRILEQLYHRHLFIDRRSLEPTVYQFHALFRAFLYNRAIGYFGPEQVQVLQREAADFLCRWGDESEALALYVNARQWDGAARVLRNAAPALIAQGRWQTLREWVLALPEEVQRGDPWIEYWLGRATSLADPTDAREILEAAFASFRKRGDEVGELMCAVAMLEILHLEFDDFRAMEPWADRVASLLESGVLPPLAEDELRANAAVMMAATYRPRHTMLERRVQRVEALLAEEPYEVNLKVAAAAMLHSYSNVALDFEAERLATQYGQALMNSPHLTPHMASFYLSFESYSHYMHGRYDTALASMRQADNIAEAHGLDELRRMVGIWKGFCERRAGRLNEAEETIARLECLGGFGNRYRAGLFAFLRAAVAFDRGHQEDALRDIVHAYQGIDASGHFGGTALAGLVAANMAIASRHYDLAEDLLRRVSTHTSGSTGTSYRGVLDLNRAWLAHRRNQPDVANALLEQSLKQASDVRGRVRFRWYPEALSEMLPVALTLGIESRLAQALARELEIKPPCFDMGAWPWPVKVYTLGRFELMVDGIPLAFSRKTPKKALALLQAIIAFGGRDVAEEKVMEALWPDEDGDAAHRVLNTTIYRLRRILGNTASIVQTGGKLALNPELCWTDVSAFEHGLARNAARNDEADEIRKQCVELYRGAFLGQQECDAWAIACRERLRTKFVLAVGAVSRHLEEEGRWQEAIERYLNGIDADNLVESFYQGLMRCYGHLDQGAEVAGIYRRLKKTFSVVLGLGPSASTEKLYRELIAAHPQIASAA